MGIKKEPAKQLGRLQGWLKHSMVWLGGFSQVKELDALVYLADVSGKIQPLSLVEAVAIAKLMSFNTKLCCMSQMALDVSFAEPNGSSAFKCISVIGGSSFFNQPLQVLLVQAASALALAIFNQHSNLAGLV